MDYKIKSPFSEADLTSDFNRKVARQRLCNTGLHPFVERIRPPAVAFAGEHLLVCHACGLTIRVAEVLQG